MWDAERRRKAAKEAAAAGPSASAAMDRANRYLARGGADESALASQAALLAGASGGGGVPREAAKLAAQPGGPLATARSAAAGLAHWRQKRALPLDVSYLPGTAALCSEEVDFCAAGRLLPSHYLALKDMMLRDAEKHGRISRAEARNYFRLEPSRGVKIYDLLVARGWLQGDKPPAVEAGSGGGGKLGAGRGRSSGSLGDLLSGDPDGGSEELEDEEEQGRFDQDGPHADGGGGAEAMDAADGVLPDGLYDAGQQEEEGAPTAPAPSKKAAAGGRAAGAGGRKRRRGSSSGASMGGSSSDDDDDDGDDEDYRQ